MLLRPRLSSLLAAGLHPHPRLPPPTTLKYGVRHPRFFTTSALPPRPSLGPHFAFCLGFGVAGLAAAAVLTNNDTAQRLKTLSRPSAWYGVERGLVASRTQDLITRARAFIRLFDPSLFWPTILAENYVSLTEAQRTCLGIVVFQGGVWVLWKIPALRRFSTRYFWHDPKIKGRTITHLTSIFSHRGLLHLGANSLGIYILAPPAMEWFQKDSDLRSTSRFEFLAFFVAAGLFSSLTSHLWSILYVLPRFGAGSVLPSLGASGAVYGAFAVTALAYPTATVSLLFLPGVAIPVIATFGGVVALDVFALLRGRALLGGAIDHAAHLGGAVAGMGYFWFGHEAFERARRWLKIREEERRKEAGRRG